MLCHARGHLLQGCGSQAGESVGLSRLHKSEQGQRHKVNTDIFSLSVALAFNFAKDGKTKVADFLGVFAEEGDAAHPWTGNLVAHNTSTPFADTFKLVRPGGPSNYTGVSQSLGPKSFVWRGRMSGVECQFAPKCDAACGGAGAQEQYASWRRGCAAGTKQW